MTTKLTIRVANPDNLWHDQGGTLYDDNGVALWSHFSSNRSFLIADLTRNFGLIDELKRRYPDGYEVEIVGLDAVTCQTKAQPESTAPNSADTAHKAGNSL